jgi:hypothetical protein
MNAFMIFALLLLGILGRYFSSKTQNKDKQEDASKETKKPHL